MTTARTESTRSTTSGPPSPSSTPSPSSKRSAASKGATAPDALAMLKADHRRVEELFEKFENAKRSDRKARIASQICDELTVHAELEERGFYPPVRKALGDDADLVDEATVEHASAKWLIEQIRKESTDSQLYEAKVTVLKEYIQHHVKEEEKTMFPKVKKSGLDTAELGETLQAMRPDIERKLIRQ